ncbi:HNH endonuclease signature motif containing protein [Stenotrophomonas sp. C3(2023)]|uniref:HNH endonuclease n=1 Tax=Stenotrophomonas sp. C3(2023) TaxID=3080277 RepID=UPI00293CC409|nr:HNH endonuclease signature motif containing protein [Stenotrophomonas sp. C3(2023)]MDV3468652.1 HNH endonuclease signature motif containing protein [Stenotrophomonas sp. C3(2023)]
MSGAVRFDGPEADYLQWLAANPHGFVVNTTRSMSPGYFFLHHASCRAINSRSGARKFTSAKYIKVCAPRVADLRAFMADNDRKDFSGYCGSCTPGAADADHDIDAFQRKVVRSLQDDPAARAARLKVAPVFAKAVQVVTTVHMRNPDVVAEVLARAKGVCGGCGSHAPFIRASDGSPYLEVHHRKRLADGGEDTVANAVALCPNCHREQHFGIKAPVLSGAPAGA